MCVSVDEGADRVDGGGLSSATIFDCTVGGRTCTIDAVDATIGASPGRCGMDVGVGTTASSSASIDQHISIPILVLHLTDSGGRFRRHRHAAQRTPLLSMFPALVFFGAFLDRATPFALKENAFSRASIDRLNRTPLYNEISGTTSVPARSRGCDALLAEMDEGRLPILIRTKAPVEGRT